MTNYAKNKLVGRVFQDKGSRLSSLCTGYFGKGLPLGGHCSDLQRLIPVEGLMINMQLSV